MKEYIHDLTDGFYGIEGMVFSPLFGEEITIRCADCSEEYIQRCAAMFVEMSEELKTTLLQATAAYALEYVEEYGLDDPDADWDFEEGSPLTDILKYIYPVCITVRQPKYMTEEDAPPCFDMELSCVWELEHGLEWVVRGGDALYVGAYEGRSPWDFFGKEDTNYINRI